MTAKILAYAVAAALMFGAGWAGATWKAGNETKQVRIDALTDQNTRQNTFIDNINKNLKDVVEKSKAAADQTQKTVDTLTTVRSQTSREMQAIAAQSKQVSNEIKMLGVPKCSYDADYGRVWNTIGENANAGRDYLYGSKR